MIKNLQIPFEVHDKHILNSSSKSLILFQFQLKWFAFRILEKLCLSFYA